MMGTFAPGMGAYMGGGYDDPGTSAAAPGQAGVGAAVSVNASTGGPTTLALLGIGILLVAFYVGTRRVQGGR